MIGDFKITRRQKKHIESFLIPVIDLYASPGYIVGIAKESVMPTDDELRLIHSTIIPNESKIYTEVIREQCLKTLPFVCGHNTVILLKGGLYKQNPFPMEGWAYRRPTWMNGPLIYPSRTEPNFKPFSIEDLIKYLYKR